MVTYTDSRGSSVSSVDPNAPVAPGDVMVSDPYGNRFITNQANAAAFQNWLAARARGDTTSPCPANAGQSNVQPVAPGTQLLPGNVWVRDRFGNQYQTTPDQAAGLQRYVNSREEPLRPGYQWVTAGGQRMQARSDMIQAMGDPSNPKFYQARQYYAGLMSVHGLSQMTGDGLTRAEAEQKRRNADPLGITSVVVSDEKTGSVRSIYQRGNDGSLRSVYRENATPQETRTVGISPWLDPWLQGSITKNDAPKQKALDEYNPIDPFTRMANFFYVPEGSYMQQQFKNVKIGLSESGEIGIYESLGFNQYGSRRMAINPDTGALEPFILIGGGGRNAAQSGMFGFAAATPAVYGRGEVQKGAAGLITPSVMAPGVETSGLTGLDVFSIVQGGLNGAYDIRDRLSRLGAEAYGGMVQRIDSRKLGNIRYEDRGNRSLWNLASYVDPLAVNRGKADLPGAHIPWSVGDAAPAFFFMDQYTKSGEDAPPIAAKSFPAYFPKYGSAYAGGNVAGTVRENSPGLTITSAMGMGSVGGRVRGSKTLATEMTAIAVNETTTATPGAPAKTPDVLGESIQKGLSFALSFGGLFPAGGLAVDTLAATVKGKPKELPLYDFGMEMWGFVTPWKQPKGTVTTKEYERGLSEYNSRLNLYNGLKGRYEAGGSQDTGIYAALQKEFGYLQGKQATLEKQRENITDEPTTLDRIGRTYEALNVGLSRYTTDISGIGSALEKTPDVNYGADIGMPIYGDIVNFGKHAYVSAAKHPIDIMAAYGGGYAVKGIETGLSLGVARTAASKIPVLSQAGRAASTPIARDIIFVGKLGLGAAMVGSTIIDIAEKPTASEKGSAFGRAMVQFAGFGAGYSSLKTPEPENYFAGREYFSGKRAFSPLEKASMDLKAFATSFEVAPELRSTYRSIPRVFREARYIEPQPGITATTPAKPFSEPDLAMAQTIGTQRAAAVRGAISEQPHALLGSIVGETQRTGLPTGELIRGYPKIHDVDVRVQDVGVLESALKARGETPAGIDAKPFEEAYPMIAGRTEPGSNEGVQRIGLLSRLFGEAIPNQQGMKLPYYEEVLIGGKDYPGVLNAEKMNVQFGRKAQAVMQDLVPAEAKAGNPDARELNELFRLPKDFYDFGSYGRDLIVAEQARMLQAGNRVTIGGSTRATKLLDKMDDVIVKFDFLPKEDNPIIGSKAGVPFRKDIRLGDIRVQYEKEILAARKAGAAPGWLSSQNPKPRPYNPGIISIAANSAARVSPSSWSQGWSVLSGPVSRVSLPSPSRAMAASIVSSAGYSVPSSGSVWAPSGIISPPAKSPIPSKLPAYLPSATSSKFPKSPVSSPGGSKLPSPRSSVILRSLRSPSPGSPPPSPWRSSPPPSKPPRPSYPGRPGSPGYPGVPIIPPYIPSFSGGGYVLPGPRHRKRRWEQLFRPNFGQIGVGARILPTQKVSGKKRRNL